MIPLRSYKTCDTRAGWPGARRTGERDPSGGPLYCGGLLTQELDRRLWRVRRRHDSIEAYLQLSSDAGWSLQFLRNGRVIVTRTFQSREEAVRMATVQAAGVRAGRLEPALVNGARAVEAAESWIDVPLCDGWRRLSFSRRCIRRPVGQSEVPHRRRHQHPPTSPSIASRRGWIRSSASRVWSS